MVKLVLDASNAHLSIACFKEEIFVDEINIECKKNLSEIILLEIDNILTKNKISKFDISEIIITKGPGSYTALRVVMSVAKTFSMLLNIPLKTVSTLKLQMASYMCKKDKLIVPILDGRRGNVYSTIYYNNNEILEEGYYSLEKLFEILEKNDKDVIFVGKDVANFDFTSLNVSYELDASQIYAKNIAYILNFVIEESYYDAVPSYLRLTEAERNFLKNDKNK